MDWDWLGEALQLHLDIDEQLAIEIEDACQRAMAHARLRRAIEQAVETIEHPALALSKYGCGERERLCLRFLGQRVLEWRFDVNEVELRSWVRYVDLFNVDDELAVIARFLGQPAPAKPPYLSFTLRYVPHAQEWRMRFVGSTDATHEFNDETEHVFAEIMGLLPGLSPWGSPSGVRWFGLQGQLRPTRSDRPDDYDRAGS
jgi:hypothetical protein